MQKTERIIRVEEKLSELLEFRGELISVLPENYEEYKEDFKSRSASERIFEKIVMAFTDISLLLIKELNLTLPEEESEAFSIIANARVIPLVLAERLKDAKGMRNILAHEYGDINNELVYNSLTEEVAGDVDEFLDSISNFLLDYNKKET